MSSIKRHEIFKSDRIKVTENKIKELNIKTVLEIGAGDYSFNYVKKNERVYWVKADFSAPSDVICDFNSDKLAIPFSEKSFDLVICTEVLEHLLWPQQLLKEAYRVLSTNGKILVSVPNINSFSYRVAFLLGHIPSCAASGNLPSEIGSTAYQQINGGFIGGHVIDFNKKRIVYLLKMSGFKVLNTNGSGIIWHKQLLPYWLVPSALSSNIICLAQKEQNSLNSK